MQLGSRPGQPATITTDIPARLDRLPLSRFHLLIVTALGVTWILDGLEVTIVGAIGPVLQNSQTLGLSTEQIGLAGSTYVIGAVIGALFHGRALEPHKSWCVALEGCFRELDMARSSLGLTLTVVVGTFVGLPNRSFADARCQQLESLNAQYAGAELTTDQKKLKRKLVAWYYEHCRGRGIRGG